MYKIQLVWEDPDGDTEFLDDAVLPLGEGRHHVETWCLGGVGGALIIELFAKVEAR